MTLDPRLNAVRADLADIRLRRGVQAPRYAAGRAAWVTAGLTPVLHAPRAGAETDTFFHYGEPVLVFDEGDGYAWCQSERDSYVGYVTVAALRAGDAGEATAYVAGPGAYRYVAPDLRSPVIDFLPRHCPVVVARTGLECRGTAYVGLDRGFLPARCLSPAPPRSSDLAAAAVLYCGCPYLWGGRSFLGVDCSGLVQEAFRDLGVAVPRDTDMQRAAIGAPVELVGLEALRRNDLIFIPGHVMIAAGDGKVIHADGGDMRVQCDQLAVLMEERGWRCGDFTVRRF